MLVNAAGAVVRRLSRFHFEKGHMAKFTKIRMNVSIAGKFSDGTDFCAQPGQILFVPVADGEKWIAVGHAERVDKSEAITETAALANNDFLDHDPRLIHRLNGVMPV
jgi:hypothetical protein